MRHRTLLVVAVAACFGCREVALCGDDTELCSDARGTKLVAPGRTQVAGGEGGAEGDVVALAGAPAVTEPCPGPRAECDGSTLTACESNLNWNARHCGACGAFCAGACFDGVCRGETVVLEDEAAVEIMGDDDRQYVLTSGGRLLMFDAALEAPFVLAEGLGDANRVALGAGIAYAWRERRALRGSVVSSPSVSAGEPPVANVQRIDQATLEVADEPLAADTFGASGDGLYYTSAGGLWFKAAGSDSATLVTADAPAILCGSEAFVVVRTWVTEPVVSRAVGAELHPLGAAPVDIVAARSNELGVGLLAREAGGHVLYWAAAVGTNRVIPLEVDSALSDDGAFVLRGDEAALTWRKSGNLHVRSVDLFGGAFAWTLGIPNQASLIHRDGKRVWYNSTDAQTGVRRLLRAGYEFPVVK